LSPFAYTLTIGFVAMPKFNLKLYITPDSSGTALAHLYTALSLLSYTDYQLEIVDVLKERERAAEAGIVVTPSLVYHAPAGDR
jgi:hypothetical protein